MAPFMELLQTIFYFIFTLGVLVTFHEYGHFWVARRCGVKVIRFSVGFGSSLFKWNDKHGTEFVVAALPLGGYVKMVDEREGEVAEQDLPYAFSRKSVWQRMAVVVAGPLANFLLAILAFWIVFGLGVTGVAPVVDEVEPGSVAEQAGLQPGQEIVAIDGEETPTWQALRRQLVYRIGETGPLEVEVIDAGSGPNSPRYQLTGQLNNWLVDAEQTDPVDGLGLTLYQPRIVPLANEIVEGDPADQAGLQSGDLIISADGRLMENWTAWVEYVRARPGETIQIEFEREGLLLTTSLTPKRAEDENGNPIGQVGMSVVIPEWPENMIRKAEYGVFEALGESVKQTWSTSILILDSVKKMMVGLISAKHLSGPITIAKVAGASAQYGVSAYLGFLALLSVSLGVLNLLPIPVLDGGHLAYYIVEAIKGSPVSEKVQMAGFRVGLFLVVGLMVLALYNDLMRL